MTRTLEISAQPKTVVFAVPVVETEIGSALAKLFRRLKDG